MWTIVIGGCFCGFCAEMQFSRDVDCLFSPEVVNEHQLGLGCKACRSAIYNIENISTEVQSVALLRVRTQVNIPCRRLKKKKISENTQWKQTSEKTPTNLALFFFLTQIGFRCNPAG